MSEPESKITEAVAITPPKEDRAKTVAISASWKAITTESFVFGAAVAAVAVVLRIWGDPFIEITDAMFAVAICVVVGIVLKWGHLKLQDIRSRTTAR